MKLTKYTHDSIREMIEASDLFERVGDKTVVKYDSIKFCVDKHRIKVLMLCNGEAVGEMEQKGDFCSGITVMLDGLNGDVEFSLS